MELNIYNNTKTNEEHKEKILDDMIKNEENCIRTVQNELLTQKETLMRKLAERKKAKERS